MGEWSTFMMEGEWGGRGVWRPNGDWKGGGEWKSGKLKGNWKGEGEWKKVNEHRGEWEGRGVLISEMPTTPDVTTLFITIVGVSASVIGLLTGVLGWIGALIIFMIITMVLAVSVLPLIIMKREGTWNASGTWRDEERVRILELSGDLKFGSLKGSLGGTMRDEIG